MELTVKYFLLTFSPANFCISQFSPGSTTQSRKKFFFSTHQTGMVTLVRPR